MPEPRVLMIVPTLGTRPELLRQSLESITSQDVAADIVVVAPEANSDVRAIATSAGAQVLADPGSLAGAINVGASALQPHHRYLNWQGDDDLLEPMSLRATTTALETNDKAVLAYGACRYIDDAGRQLWISKAGKWAPRILKWGPDLIPQPGMLVKAEAWKKAGGLDESFRFAFDLDLLLKLQPQGSFIDVDKVVSAFRWHGDSLTVSDRTTSLQESERARRRALSPAARKCAWMWEGPVRAATRAAAWEVTRRAKKAAER